MRVALSPFYFKLFGNSESLSLDIVSQDLENTLDIIQRGVGNIDLLLEFGDFIMNVEGFGLFQLLLMLDLFFLQLFLGLILLVGPEDESTHAQGSDGCARYLVLCYLAPPTHQILNYS